MTDPIIQCFKDEFDRFYDMLLMQIQVCPDSLWTKTEGGYLFWQQLFHAVAATEIYALQEGAPSKQTLCSREAAMLSAAAQETISKTALTAFAADIRQSAHQFIDSMTTDTLTARHEKISNALGKNLTNQNALIAMIRHLCYHLGCCDAILRSHGLKGVY